MSFVWPVELVVVVVAQSMLAELESALLLVYILASRL
jgi:hypothetical protein